MTRVIIFLVSIFLISSCSDLLQPKGKWDDNIKLSTRSVEFGAGADSAIITTKGNWWWIDGISFEDSTYMYYNRKDIDLESEAYIIVENCFVVERRDKNTLYVKFNENITGKERLMRIDLEAGDYFDYVNVKQSAH